MPKDTVSILGCGWLGLPLAEHLADSGYKVMGSSRTERGAQELNSLGIDGYHICLTPHMAGIRVDEFLDSGILVVNFPPERREDIVDFHRAQIKSLISSLTASTVEYVIFVSSTSVYPDVNREVAEDGGLTPTKSSGLALMEAERLLNDCNQFQTTVIRFGGLIGYDRKPGRFLAQKREVSNGEAPVNLIHRDDCIAVIEIIIEKKVWGVTLNACADRHPKRKDYYISEALKLGLEPPVFKDSGEKSYKLVSSDKLKNLTGYSFKYPDPQNIAED